MPLAATDTIIGSLDVIGVLLSCSLTVGFARASLAGHSRRPRGFHAPAYDSTAKLVFASRSHFVVGRSASFLFQRHFLAAEGLLAAITKFIDRGGQRHQVQFGECCLTSHANLLRTSAVAAQDTSVLSD